MVDSTEISITALYENCGSNHGCNPRRELLDCEVHLPERNLGAKIKELISIVSYSMFHQWIRSREDTQTHLAKPKEGKSGRPRVEESISEAILCIRQETNWGYTKIVQALRDSGILSPARRLKMSWCEQA
jgi:hypothetical protein